MTLTIVVPCYNEAENISLILKRFAEVITKNVNVILVNNGSTDNSAEVMAELVPKFDFVQIVTVLVNQGYGYGILQGLNSASGDYIGWTHADMQADPADVIKAFSLAENADQPVFVKGNRKGRPIFDRIFTFGMSLFETIYLGKRLYDINAQPNIFPRTFFDTWKEPPFDFALDLYAIYMAQAVGLKVVRFTVLFPKRIHGISHWNTGFSAKCKFIKRTVDFSIKLKNGGIS